MSVTNRGRFLPRFPTAVTPSGPITSTQVGLTLTLGADFRPLGAAGPSYDTALVAIVQDPTTGAFSKITLANLFANSQPLNTALTALATVTPAADTVPYFTGASSAAVTPFTSYGRTIVGTASASAARTALGSTTVGDALFIAANQAAAWTALGNVPVTSFASGTGAAATTFWRGDGTWAQVSLSAAVTGTLPVANGGTGQTTAAAAFGALKQAATTSATGVVELATDAETQAQSSSAVVVTPSNLAQRVAFHAHKNGTSQTGMTSGTETKLTFGTELFDVGGYYDTSTSRFTPPAGRYRLSAVALTSAGAVDQAALGLIIYKNGSAHKKDFDAFSGAINKSARCTTVVEASGTDFFEIYFVAFGAGTKDVNGAADSSWFCGEAI